MIHRLANQRSREQPSGFAGRALQCHSRLRLALIRLVLVATGAWLCPLPAMAQLLLAGGALPVCTSMRPDQCTSPPAWSVTALDEHRFGISDPALERWHASLGEDHDAALRASWQTVLSELATDIPNPIDLAQLRARIQDRAPDLLERIDARAWWQLVDHLQEPLGDRREQVRLDQSDNAAAVEIFRHFVGMAARLSQDARPRIAVSTASSRDPYDALDFYLQVFEQAGAEVVWLPLDRAVSAARSTARCERLADFQAALLGSWDRERVHPERFRQQLAFCAEPALGPALIDTVDGLFLNGGDQWLTLHAFVDEQGGDSPELARIRQRLQADQLVLGGTSAGAAVQSGPVMISNGSSAAALRRGSREQPPPPPGCERSGRCPEGLAEDDLSFHRGGLGSFSHGIVDTHFSERWRQLRLLQLLSDTGLGLGLGVDETSAVEVSGLSSASGPVLSAMGASGAWLIDMADAQAENDLPLRIRGVRLHYLAPGSRLALDGAQAARTPGAASPAQAAIKDCPAAAGEVSFAAMAASMLHHEASSCVRFDLGGDTLAIGHFEPVPPPGSGSGELRSWRWSLEVVKGKPRD